MPIKRKNNVVRIIIFLCLQVQYGQEVDSIVPDFLKNNSYDSIYSSYMDIWKDTLKSKVYLNAWVKKAEKENNLKKKAEALTFLSYYANTESRKLQLLDSAILLSKDSKYYPILPYSFKGGYFKNKGLYQLALNNYLKALEFSEKAKNITYVYNTKHNIGELKISVGKYDEAILLFKECLEYDIERLKTESHGHIETILAISEAYLKNQQLDSASIYIEEGLKKTKYTYPDLYNQLILLKGIHLFFLGQLEPAGRHIERAIFLMNKRDPQTRRFFLLGYFYLGKINVVSENTEKAEYYFLELDSIISENKVLNPEIREGYLYLIAHYKQSGEKINQLQFVNKLLEFDSILKTDRNILSSRITNEFDTPQLLKEKDVLIGELLNEKRNLSYFLQISFVAIITVIIGLLYQYRKRRSYKSKFLELIKDQESITANINGDESEDEISSKSNTLNISPQIITNILKALTSFEAEKKFLNKDITSSELACSLGTNTKYLSQIINYYKKKSFSNYIKDLRISYAIQQLKVDPSLRNFSIQGISQEMGFNSTESFSSAFRKKTGIKPSYFIREYNNLKAKDFK